MKLYQREFSMGIRKRFFTKKLLSHWNWLPRNVVVASSLSEFKEHPNDALSPVVNFTQSCDNWTGSPADKWT